MSNTNRSLLLATTGLFCIVIFISWSLNVFLFHLSDYNVYRVLDLSFSSFFFLVLILIVQYVLLKWVYRLVNEVGKTVQSYKIFALLLLFFTGMGLGIAQLIPINLPFWIYPIVLVALCGYTFFIKWLNAETFQKAIYLLLFGAMLNSSLIFWMHEEANEGRHLEYAKQLAERKDLIAENQLNQLVALNNVDTTKIKDRHYWEKVWLNDPYLSSNYQLDLHQSRNDSSAVFYQPILRFEEEYIPIYWIYFPEDYALSFTLNVDFRRSVYTANKPYKNLENLDNYQFAVVNHSDIVLSNTHAFDLNILDAPLPPIGTGKKIKWQEHDLVVYHHAADVYVFIGEPLSEIAVWISNFAFIFSVFIGIAVFMEVGNLLFFQKNLFSFWQKLPIQFQIQTVLLSLTLLMFFIIAATTFYFLHENNLDVSYERQLYISETLRKEIIEEVEQNAWGLADFKVRLLAELADRQQCDIDFYDTKGQLIVTSHASAKNSLAPDSIKLAIQTQIRKNVATILVHGLKKGKESIFRTYFGVSIGKELQGFVAINSFESATGTAQDIPIIMSKLLDVYVFLLLLTISAGFLLILLLTNPLKLLSKHLSNFKLGHQNEKLNWGGDGVIGQLIQEYNKMVETVEQTTKELMLSEREGAWQIMAQQIAHEINNPLTPIRLNIQFLNRILETEQPIEVERVKRITDSLVERVDYLSKVANQFQLFAKLDTPESQPLALKEFLSQFSDTFQTDKKQGYQFLWANELEATSNPIIQIDPHHLEQVLQNIIQNAEKAIEEKANGFISLRLTMEEGKAIIEIEDNGTGIDSNLMDIIFEPKFSTNSSQTGLGLPICRRIVEFYSGHLSFTTEKEKGTCFKIAFSALQEKEG